MLISRSSRRAWPDQSFFISLKSLPWNVCVLSVREFSDGIHRFYLRTKIFRSFIFPERSQLIEAWAVPNVLDFQSFVGFINLRDFNIAQLCTFLCGLAFFTGVYAENSCKPLWFFYFSLWLVCHFENPLRWACALSAISDRARLEPGKTNVRRKGKRAAAAGGRRERLEWWRDVCVYIVIYVEKTHFMTLQ